MSVAGRTMRVITVLGVKPESRFRVHRAGRSGGGRGPAASSDVSQWDLAEALIVIHVQRREVSFYSPTYRRVILQTVTLHALLHFFRVGEFQTKIHGMTFGAVQRALGIGEL